MTNFLYLNEFGDALLVRHEGERTLETLQTLVQGLIQGVLTDPARVGFTADVWVNEEGLYEPTFTINPLASVFTGHRLVGPAVVSEYDDDGRTVGLSNDAIARLREDGLFIDDNDGKGWTAEDAVALRERIVSR